MRRRDFLAGLAATGIGSAGLAREARTVTATAASGQIPELVFDSSASLLDSSYGELTDSTVVPVTLEGTATNDDDDGNGDAVVYSDGTKIPVVATDGDVVGVGGRLVEDGTNWQKGNEEFLLNVWDEHAGGGTVLYDEGHGQFYTLSGDFSEFADYAENNGYTVTATTSLAADLSGADAAWITSPANSFTQSELDALANFVASGGAVFLHDQSDYSDYDETGNLNEIAGNLGLAFRFNDDQVVDEVVNAGENYQPLTDEFDTNFPYFGDRDGLGLDPDKTYTVPVKEVLDGDTVKVTMDDGTVENIRVLGLDTPEKSSNSQYERIQEWEGIESNTYLEGWADDATQFGKDKLSGETIDLYFDPEEPVRDPFGRLLGYIDYDDTGDGNRDSFYNLQCVERGYARLYDSGFSKHESFWQAEDAARTNGTRVWTDSDPANTSEIRDRAVDDLFFPDTASVRTASGAIADSRVPVYAETSASQDLDGGHDYSGDVPLVGVDETNRVAVVGGPFVDESYEKAEGFAVDTSDFENYVFAINLADYLSNRSGDVLVDGSHGQFNASYGLAAEDVAWWMRYLEGQGVGLEGINSLTADDLSRGRTLVVTTPEQAFTQSEIDAISSFLSDGGSVVLVGCGKVTAEARGHLNDLAAGLGTDLRVNEDQVTDDTNNVNADSDIPTTTQFDQSFPLFDPYTDGSDASVAVSTGSTSNVTTSSVTLNGSLDDLGGASSADCYFEYRQVGASSWNSTAAQTFSATGSYSDSVSGLSSGTDYEFRAVANAADGDSDTGTAATFTTDSDASVAVSTGGSSNVDASSATLGGSLDDLGGASSADCYFEYRQVGASSWSATTAQSLSSTGSYSDSVSGLSENTEYEFRAVADASDGDSDAGSAVTFTTSDDPAAVSTGSAADVTDSSATLNGSLDDLGGASSADCYFEYRQVGASSWSATTAQSLSSTGSYSDSVSGLASGTDYEFRAVTDAADGDSDAGTAATFTTGSGTSDAGEISLAEVHADASGGDDNDNLTDEYVVFDNVGTATLDLTGWAVEDAVAKHYDFPDNFTLDPGQQVTLHTGSGTDTETDLYWGYGSAVWNNSGDTVYVFDDAGSQVLSRTYSGDSLVSVAVSTGSATAVGSSSATLNGSLDDLGGAASADVQFEYRKVGDSSWMTTSTQTLSSTGSFSDTVSSLTTGADYEFRAVAAASDGDEDGDATATFTTGSDSGAVVSTGSASSLTDSSATLGGSLDDLGGASSADCYFEYRETGSSSWTATAAQTLSSTGSFSDSISGLAENTEYEFRAVADASDGDSDTGSAVTFTTGDDPAAVSTGSASSVTDSGATLNGSLDDLGGASSADCYFEYRQVGASSWNATTAQSLSSTGSFSDSVSGLASGTDYEFRAVADASDGDSDTGTAATFTTGSGSGELAIAQIHEDAEGNEYDNLNDEYVVFENVGTGALDLTGWAVEDEAGKHYDFPDSFTLDAGAQVTLHTGSGTDTATDLYWGYGSPVWNNSGDTVYVFDDAGSTVISKSYS